MPRGTPGALSLGPGYLFIAALGATEPTDLATAQGNWAAIDSRWVGLGYTEEGSAFTYALESDTVDVAEELDPVSTQTTGRTGRVAFSMAEVTATNLKYALNGGTITPGTGIVTFEPPDLGAEGRVMLGFESEDHTERWVYRQCFNQGDVEIPRRKGTDKAVIPVEFNLEKPATGLKLFKAIFAAPLRD